MSERQSTAFYGEDGVSPLAAMLATLRILTGSESCAEELIQAANEVEAITAGAALTAMPHWIN
jgi:hypothetical protein